MSWLEPVQFTVINAVANQPPPTGHRPFDIALGQPNSSELSIVYARGHAAGNSSVRARLHGVVLPPIGPLNILNDERRGHQAAPLCKVDGAGCSDLLNHQKASKHFCHY